MRLRKFLLAMILLAAITALGRADNIWDRCSTRYGYLFEDNHARHIGDVLTITIVESSNITNMDQRQLSRSTNAQETFAYSGSSTSDNAKRNGTANLQLSNASSRAFQGNAGLTDTRLFTDQMAVTVVDILPNGVLVVEGRRVRNVEGEQRVLRITGLIRPADLDPTNNISSGLVANFTIEYVGHGLETIWTMQGFLGKAFNILWPF